MNVLDYFPHRTPRKYQKDVIQKGWDLHRSDEIDYIIIQAPTGSGKTAAAGTIANASGSGYYLAQEKIHQDQVKEEFDEAAVVKGQLNYRCGDNRNPPCEDSIPREDMSCSRKPNTTNAGELAAESYSRGDLYWQAGIGEKCPYMKSKMDGLNSRIAALNYSYFMNETYYSEDFGPRDVMVLDEAHNIDDHVTGFLTFRIDEFITEETGLELFDRGEGVEDWSGWVVNNLHDAIETRLDELGQKVEHKWENDEKIPQELLNKRDVLDEVACNVRRFNENYFEGSEWAIEKEYDEDGSLTEVKFSPVTVAPFTERVLFDYADTVIFLSATVLDYEVFLRTMGLSSQEVRERTVFFNLPSTFPPENRKIYQYNGPSVSYDNWDETFPKIVDLIDTICQKHPDESGIIHSVSYRNGDCIVDNVSRDTRLRIMRHDRDIDREKALMKFRDAGGNRILMSPSMYEGVDLPGDMSRFQIIPKVPYLSLGSNVVKKHQDIDPKWYIWKTIVRICQSFGRSVRSERDWASTYILDGNFNSLLEENQDMFPDYIIGNQDKDIPCVIEERGISELLQKDVPTIKSEVNV